MTGGATLAETALRPQMTAERPKPTGRPAMMMTAARTAGWGERGWRGGFDGDLEVLVVTGHADLRRLDAGSDIRMGRVGRGGACGPGYRPHQIRTGGTWDATSKAVPASVGTV